VFMLCSCYCAALCVVNDDDDDDDMPKRLDDTFSSLTAITLLCGFAFMDV